MRVLAALLLLLPFSCYSYTTNDHCLAIAVHKEASKTIYKDQVAVYQVIKNRAQKLSMSVCEVLKQPRQFSFVKTGMSWIANKKQLALLDKIKKERIMFSSDVMYFHSKPKDPVWARKMVHVLTVGKHKYFKEK